MSIPFSIKQISLGGHKGGVSDPLTLKIQPTKAQPPLISEYVSKIRGECQNLRKALVKNLCTPLVECDLIKITLTTSAGVPNTAPTNLKLANYSIIISQRIRKLYRQV